MTRPAPVEVAGLVRRHGDVTAADGVELRVEHGEMFGLIGPDGAGKTTTLRCVLGLLQPHAGVIRTCGLEPVSHRRQLSGRVGYLSQRFSLYGDLTVDENVGFFAEIHGVANWRPSRERLLDLVRLTPFRDRLADRLSGGMKQKLALACTLVHTPELLVLDEATTGVDPVSRREFWKLLARLQQGGLTILLTTPYLDEAERCTRVALMDRGRILVTDEPLALRTRAPGVVIELLANPTRAAADLLRGEPGVVSVQLFGERVHATLAGSHAASPGEAAAGLRRRLESAGLTVQAAQPITPSLEDVFISRLREAGGAGDRPAGWGGPAT